MSKAIQKLNEHMWLLMGLATLVVAWFIWRLDGAPLLALGLIAFDALLAGIREVRDAVANAEYKVHRSHLTISDSVFHAVDGTPAIQLKQDGPEVRR